MDNNKYRIKDRDKSNAELRKMFPKDGADIGYKNGKNLSNHVHRLSEHAQMSHIED